jgi:hypothetical protein
VDGEALLTFLKRRLAENGLTLGEAREGTLLDALTEGRDVVQGILALVAPELFASDLTLELDDADLNQYKFADEAADAVRTVGVFLSCSGTLRMLTPSAQLNRDLGEYAWTSPRTLRLNRGISLGATDSLVVRVIPHGEPIEDDTPADEIGLPAPCHRAIGLQAAVAVLTIDEESDAAAAEKRFAREMERLEQLYGSYDVNDGMKLRHAMLASAADEFGDMLP